MTSPNPSIAWDRVAIYGFYFKADDVTPDPGSIKFKFPERITRVDGRRIYSQGAEVTRTIGDHETESAVRDAVRNAWRAADQATVTAAGGTFDGAAWDARWNVLLTGAVFASFPASDDPDIVPRGWQVIVEEKLNSGGGKVYPIQPLLADLASTPPGINLGLIDVPPGSPTAPAPIYQKGQPGGVAALDSDGDVIDAFGAKVIAGAGGGTGEGSAVTLDADGTLTVDGVTVEVATDGQLTAEATARADGDSALDARLDTLETSAPAAASTTTAGLVELATNTEALAGTDAARALTPAALEGVLAEERTQQSATYATQAALATNATADRARANHTGTQTSATISDFTEAAQDAVAALLAQGTGVTLTYNDAGNTLTVASTGSGGITDAEVVRDTIGAALLGAGLVTVALNDAADTITISTTATANSTDAALRDRATHTGAQDVSTVTGLQAALDAKVARAGAIYTGAHDFTGATVTGIEGSSGGGQAAGATLLRLTAPDGGLWDLTAADDGVPVTTAAPAEAVDGADALRLVSPDGTLYAYTVANDGVLNYAEVV